ncbi:AzlD domain-containing protein [Microbulbifer sp. JMSA004]|uniref:AzlD domain-containing protein n=1 Tax=unclassified Microbulbifer TaxID=2619833 RepID=UPI0024ADAD52|nr:AzlD domain-containing protein [Microbulbifer sp. VAAF005]WHI45604.1 AzlD domain-containing protein [Microbulbifer sp. VAAF005]
MSIYTILAMSAITFYMRYAFFIKNLPIKLNNNTQRFLRFTAPCILASMAAPIVFGEVELSNSDLTNPFLVAGLFTILVSCVIRNTLAVVFLSIFAFSAMKFFFG